jgi:hypothetical protein
MPKPSMDSFISGQVKYLLVIYLCNTMAFLFIIHFFKADNLTLGINSFQNIDKNYPEWNY